MLQTLLRPIARARYARVVNGDGFRAVDSSIIGDGEDALRVLLLGSGVSSGWGVRSHGLALTGLLRTHLQRRVQRECSVELIGDEAMNLASALAWLGGAGREQWDAVIVAVGINDAARLCPISRWRQDMTAVLDHLEDVLPSHVPLLIAGIPPLRSIAPLRSFLTSTTARCAEALNDATIALLRRRAGRAAYVAMPAKATEAKRPWGSPTAYTPWAEAIADRLAPALVETVEHPAPAATSAPRTALAPHVRAAMEDVYADRPTLLRDIATRAKDHFDADLVQINLIDGDRIWVAANSNRSATTSLPRSLTYCDITLEQGELEVRNARRDPRFARNPLLDLTGLNSYAGAAIYAGSGEPIGTVCLFGGATATGVDMRALRAVARQVEHALPPAPAPETASDERRPMPAPRRDGAAAAETVRTDEVAAMAERPTGAGRIVQYAHEQRFFRGQGRRFEARSRRGQPHPPRHERVALVGPDPIRVLVVGGDYAVGYGATGRDGALDGHLAHLLHRRTGRGVVVENRSQPGVRLEDLPASLGRIGAYTFDVVVWTPTFAEATRHFGFQAWHDGVARLLRQIDATSDSGVVLLGIPQLLGAQPLAVLARLRAGQINRTIRATADEHRRTVFVEPPALSLGTVAAVAGPHVYSAAADRALPALLEALEREPTTPRPQTVAVPQR